MGNLQQSYREYDPNKIEKRSELFLKRIIGEEKLYKLKKDGKIEIEVDNKLNGKTIYELYSDGSVINKTKSQSYCIVADRSDYPINDMVAIKYAYLVHSNEIAEKVANRTNLRAGKVSSPGYNDYVDYMLNRGWHRELVTIDQNNTSISGTRYIHRDTSGCAIDIVCSTGTKMSIMGTQQVPRGSNGNIAYSMGLYITDENGKEIPDHTKIRITKERTSEFVIQLSRLYYSDVKMKDGDANYRFMQGIELNGQDHLMIYIVNPECNIPSGNVRFKIESDIWNAS